MLSPSIDTSPLDMMRAPGYVSARAVRPEVSVLESAVTETPAFNRISLQGEQQDEWLLCYLG